MTLLRKATEIGASLGRKAREILIKGAKIVKKAAVGAVSATCDLALRAWNDRVGRILAESANLATSSETLESALVDLLGADEKQPNDGALLDRDCRARQPSPADAKPSISTTPGKRPSCGGYNGMPKITYTNGINTTQPGACETMQQIADSRCVEVVGVYNAGEGFGADLAEAVENINRTGKAPASKSQAALIRRQLTETDDKVTIYAHSQGGLITQESLAQVKEAQAMDYYDQGYSPEEVKQLVGDDMSRIEVNSFGTAEDGWPEGPKYNRYTNTSDPIPKVITKAQMNKEDIYPRRRALPKSPPPHRFTNPFLNPINAHLMKTAYLPELDKHEPHLKPPNPKSTCQCKLAR